MKRLLAGLLGLALVLGACGSTTSPSPASGSPAASPTTSPSAAGPSPTPAATASAPSVDGEAIIEEFVALVADPALTFHVGSTFAITIGPQTVEVDVEGDFAGEDFAGTVGISAGAQSVETEVILVDGTAYGRLAGLGWQELPDFDESQTSNPFGGVTAADLEYVGPAPGGGHILRWEDALARDPQEMENETITNVEVESAVMDIVVEDDGTPVSADYALQGSAEVEGVPGDLEFDGLYEFSNVGGDVTIEAPEV